MKNQLLSTLMAIVFLDQSTKYLAAQAGAVQLNTGISFGLSSSSSQALLSFGITLVMAGLWFWQKKLWLKYPVIAGLLFGGGISNMIDRLIFSGVRDWLPVPGFNLSNNIADWSITLSLAAILLLEIQSSRAKKSNEVVHEH